MLNGICLNRQTMLMVGRSLCLTVPKACLDSLSITIRMTIVAEELEVEVTAPSRMETRGDDYFVSKTSQDVYYLSQTYGDLTGKSRKDLQISSGVVGELGEQMSDTIFSNRLKSNGKLKILIMA